MWTGVPRAGTRGLIIIIDREKEVEETTLGSMDTLKRSG